MTMPAPVVRTWTSEFETVACYACGSTTSRELLTAEDDLTGKPGRFRFVTCTACGLAYQNPRVTLEHIGEYYGDDYIAHRRTRDWGVLAPLVERGMAKLDVAKERIVARYAPLKRIERVLDVGCGRGSFLHRLHHLHGIDATAVDFKDFSSSALLEGIHFRCGLFYEVPLPRDHFDLVTMWHFLEHDYDPPRSLRRAREVLRPGGTLIVEVPRLDSRTRAWFGSHWPGLQAPQHTVLFDREHLLEMARGADLEVIDYLPYGAFPAYFYLFTGAAFCLLDGRGLDLNRAIVPYFIGQALLAPLLLFERRLNLAMQTVICRRRA
jgi:2-polyprenyl-3-methyl-5-hydroxy-6-metoxy-1,4-benzoquinol methylase